MGKKEKEKEKPRENQIKDISCKTLLQRSYFPSFIIYHSNKDNVWEVKRKKLTNILQSRKDNLAA